MNEAEILLECLIKEGAKYIFGNPGATEVEISRALSKKPEVEYILTLHESVSIGVTDDCARVGGIEIANVIKHSAYKPHILQN